jgi:hypothetical protein
MTQQNQGIKISNGVAGVYHHRVMNRDGTPATDWSAPQKNLILPAGHGNTDFFNMLTVFHVGTGTTPNKATLDGTYSQTGTTVTRATGSGTFVSGNINDFIKFGTGERARIASLTNSLTVEVDRSQTVAATSLQIYDTSRTLLDAWVKSTTTADGTAGASGVTLDSDLGTCLTWATRNFAIETSAQTYTEVGISRTGTTGTSVLFSRVVLDSPVSVGVDQFLQLRFDLLCVLGNYRTSAPITVAITGWPFPYQIQSIVSNGTFWDVVVNTACNAHYAVGRPIIITGALPATSPITSITSTVSNFTVTTSAVHGKIAGDSIVIAGSSVAGYNATWTVASAPTTTTLVVTSGANLGSATGGTVRLTTPATWFNGTHTIASFPNATTIRITNATTIPAAGVAGTVTNSLEASAIITGTTAFGRAGFTGGIVECVNGGKGMAFIAEANLRSGLTYGTTVSGITPISSQTTSANGAYDAINRTQTFTSTFVSANQNSTTIRQLYVGNSSSGGQLFITFDERQRKDNGFQMVLNFTVSWEPDLA